MNKDEMRKYIIADLSVNGVDGVAEVSLYHVFSEEDRATYSEVSESMLAEGLIESCNDGNVRLSLAEFGRMIEEHVRERVARETRGDRQETTMATDIADILSGEIWERQ